MALLYPCFSQVWMLPYPSAAENSKEIMVSNKIKSESIYSYSFTKKKINDSTCIARLTFDSLGNMIENDYFITEFSTRTTKIDYQYNEDHSIHKKTTEYSFPGPYQVIIEYEYDSAGDQIGAFTYSPDTSFLEVEKNIFNENHQLVTSYKKTGRGDFFLKSRWYYSEDGASSKEESFNERGVLYESHIVESDTSNNKKTIYRQDKKGKHGIEEFFFDNTRQCITHKLNVLVSKGNVAIHLPESSEVPAIEQYSYNPDGSFFECTTLLDNSRSNIFRVYYQKR
jgi:hypothetical protein